MEFDKSASEYNKILNGALTASGYGWDFFARYKARFITDAASAIWNLFLNLSCPKRAWTATTSRLKVSSESTPLCFTKASSHRICSGSMPITI
jgi:hypothetical protein